MEAKKKDVTVEFHELCSLLLPGEMVRSQHFELSKAISAVELFSPKMDAGAEPRRPQPEDIELRFGDLKEEEILAIVDRLWCLELAFYDGASLAQSVFTCLYAHGSNVRKAKEQAPVLYAFLISTLRACTHAHQLVIATQVCFEEDFSTGSLGIEHLGDSLTDEECAKILLEAVSKTENKALQSRLLLRNFLTEANLSFDKFRFEQAEMVLLQASNELARTMIGKFDSHNVDFAFDSYVNFWRLIPSPPRPIVNYDAAFVAEGWHWLIEGYFLVCNTRHTVKEGNARGELISLFEEVCTFSKTKRGLNAVVRSRMFASLCDMEKRIFGVAPWRTIIAKDVSLWGSDATSSFMEEESIQLQAASYLFEMFRALCFNPARQRRRLVHRIEDMGALQQRCENADARRMNWTDFDRWEPTKKQKVREEYQLPLGAWACEWCLRIMERFLEMGSELQLYRPREASSIIYYLYSLYRNQTTFHVYSLNKRNLKVEPETSAKHPFAYVLTRRAEMLDLKRIMCMGAVQLLICLNIYGETKDPQAVFDYPRMHFEHRFFDPFSTVWLPTPLHFQEIETAFSKEILQKQPLARVMDNCAETLTKAREAGKELVKKVETTTLAGKRVVEEIKLIVKCAIRHLLALEKLKSAVKAKQTITHTVVFDVNADASLLSVVVEVNPSTT